MVRARAGTRARMNQEAWVIRSPGIRRVRGQDAGGGAGGRAMGRLASNKWANLCVYVGVGVGGRGRMQSA